MHEVEFVLVSLLVSVARPRRGRARGEHPVPDRARDRRAGARLHPRAAGHRARAGARPRHLPAAAALLGGLLRQPARPAARSCGRSRCRRSGSCCSRCARSPWWSRRWCRTCRGRAAFTLGAIVAPTDPVAATTIMRRMAVPRRIVSVVEGESLINDGTALVAYRTADRGGRRHVLGLGGGPGLRRQRRRRRRDRPGRRLGDRADPAADRRHPGRDHDLAAERLRRLRAGRGARRLRRARGGHDRHRARLEGALHLDRLDAPPGLRGLGDPHLPAQRAAVRADRAAAAAHPRRAVRPAGRRAAVVVRRGQPRRHRHAADLEPDGRLRDPGARPPRVAARAPLDLAEPR